MDLRGKIQRVLREAYGGKFDSYLESKYEEKITSTLVEGDMSNKKEWITYNQVILELKNNIKDMLRVKELQYRLTDREDPNEVCIEILENVKDLSPELDRLYNKIRNFG